MSAAGFDVTTPEGRAAVTAALRQLKQLYVAIEHITATKYIFVASIVLLYWDIFLTFDLEYERVWKTRASLGKYLFIVNRYVPPILFIFDAVYQLHPSPSLQFCRNSLLPSSLLGIVTYGSIAAVLVLRTHALYQKQWLLWIMVALTIITCGTMAGIFSYIFKEFITFVPPGTLPGIPGCASECGDPKCRFLLTVFWIPFFVLETLTVSLTAWKSWTSYRQVGKNRSPFVTIVYRDGLMWYAVIMAMSIVNLVIWVAAPATLIQIAVSLLRALETTIASRLLLNIRGMLDRNYGTSTYFETMSQTQVSSVGHSSQTAKRTFQSEADTQASHEYPLSNMKGRSQWENDGW